MVYVALAYMVALIGLLYCSYRGINRIRKNRKTHYKQVREMDEAFFRPDPEEGARNPMDDFTD